MKLVFLVNNIVIVQIVGIYNWLVECASFKSWSPFVLVLYTAFYFYIGFSV